MNYLVGIFCLGCLYSFALILSAWGLGYRINSTSSLPRGLYQLTHLPIEKGAIVGACANHKVLSLALSRGYLSPGCCSCDGSSPLMKRVAALSGDVIRITDEGVFVNGKLAPNSRPLQIDSNGHAMPIAYGCYTLGSNQVLLLSDSPKGFDGRYFGPVAKSDIFAVVKPVLTYDG